MKAILVIDMPNKCTECPCFYDYLHCQAKENVDVLGDERPDNCPLKPLPPYKKSLYLTDHKSIMINQPSIYESGWNDCIDEILGGNDE